MNSALPGRVWATLWRLRNTAEMSLLTEHLLHLPHNNDRIAPPLPHWAQSLKADALDAVGHSPNGLPHTVSSNSADYTVVQLYLFLYNEKIMPWGLTQHISKEYQMSSAFLSHSSNDKDFVESIANSLGRNHCTYDKYTFEIGKKTIDEIFKNLNRSDIFVYFISDVSLKSDWIKRELNEADNLLNASQIKQIFPLIIDGKITHDDTRIAKFLKDDYNLQRVDNPQIAFRKILNQMLKINYEQDASTSHLSTFYGRDKEVKIFKDRLDDLKLTPLKAVIASGIPGIGKKTCLCGALASAKIIEGYYRPVTIPMSKDENIEDLILKLSEAGYGDYTLTSLPSSAPMDEKIKILSSLFNKIIHYKDILIIEDNECLIGYQGELKYWFDKALDLADDAICVAIATLAKLDPFKYKKNCKIISIELEEMPPNEISGLLRVYSTAKNQNILRTDFQYLINCFSGYPPQVEFCVDLIEAKGIEYVKANSFEISQHPERISSNILSLCEERGNREYLNGLLATIALFGEIPMRILTKICTNNHNYRDALGILKAYSVCYHVGSTKEYLKMNLFIKNYIDKLKYGIPADIESILTHEITEFNTELESDKDISLWDNSAIKFFLKENLKHGINSSSNFLYSTIYLQTIRELYNNEAYSQIIDIVSKMKDQNRFDYLEDAVKNRIQHFLCLCYARNLSSEFDAQVQYFKDINSFSSYIEYNFLKGFYNRNRANYSDAETYFLNVLKRNRCHLLAKRELASVYSSLHDYVAAYDMARECYLSDRENLYAIQAYFECLIESPQKSNNFMNEIEEILNTVEYLHRRKETSFFYEIHAKYYAYVKNDITQAVQFIDSGLERYPKSRYLLKDKFDIYRKAHNLNRMKEVLPMLEQSVNHLPNKGVYLTRKAICDLYDGKPETQVRIFLQQQRGFSDHAIQRLIEKYRVTK